MQRFTLFFFTAIVVVACESRTSHSVFPTAPSREEITPVVSLEPLAQPNRYRFRVKWIPFSLPHRCSVERKLDKEFEKFLDLDRGVNSFTDLSSGPLKIHRYRILCARLYDQKVTLGEAEGKAPEDLDISGFQRVGDRNEGYGRIFIRKSGRVIIDAHWAKMVSVRQIIAEKGGTLELRSANFPLDPLVTVEGVRQTQLTENLHYFDWLSQGSHDLAFEQFIGRGAPDFEHSLPFLSMSHIPHRREEITYDDLMAMPKDGGPYDLYFPKELSPWYHRPKFSKIVAFTLHVISLSGELNIANRKLCYRPSAKLPPNWDAELTRKVAGDCPGPRHPSHPGFHLEISENSDAKLSVETNEDIKGNFPPPFCLRIGSRKSEPWWSKICDDTTIDL